MVTSVGFTRLDVYQEGLFGASCRRGVWLHVVFIRWDRRLAHGNCIYHQDLHFSSPRNEYGTRHTVFFALVHLGFQHNDISCCDMTSVSDAPYPLEQATMSGLPGQRGRGGRDGNRPERWTPKSAPKKD